MLAMAPGRVHDNAAAALAIRRISLGGAPDAARSPQRGHQDGSLFIFIVDMHEPGRCNQCLVDVAAPQVEARIAIPQDRAVPGRIVDGDHREAVVARTRLHGRDVDPA